MEYQVAMIVKNAPTFAAKNVSETDLLSVIVASVRSSEIKLIVAVWMATTILSSIRLRFPHMNVSGAMNRGAKNVLLLKQFAQNVLGLTGINLIANVSQDFLMCLTL